MLILYRLVLVGLVLLFMSAMSFSDSIGTQGVLLLDVVIFIVGAVVVRRAREVKIRKTASKHIRGGARLTESEHRPA